MTPENTLGGDPVPTTEPMPDPVIDPTAPTAPMENPDPVIDPTVSVEPTPAETPAETSTEAPVAEPVVPTNSQTFGDDPTKSLDQPTNPTPAPAEQPEAAKKPKNIGKLVGIIVGAVVVLALIIVAIIFLPKLFVNVDTAKHDDDAFFVEEKNGSGSFAIFNRKGEQVTDFIYGNVSTFNHGHAVACERDNSQKCGIVTSVGTTSTAFGSYETLSSVGGLYIATNGGKRVLINYAGKQIATLPSGDDADAGLFIRDEASPFVIHNYGDNKYKLYTGEGDELLDFESTSTPTLFHNYDLSVSFMSTDKKVYAIDDNEQSIIIEAEADYIYGSVKDVSSDKKTLILQTSAKNEKVHHYAIYADKNITVVDSDECNDLVFAEDDNESKMNYVQCVIGSYKYMVDAKGNVSHENSYDRKRIDAGTYVTAENKYGYSWDEDDYQGTIMTFYKDGKEVKKVRPGVMVYFDTVSANGYYTFYVNDTDNRRLEYYVYDTNGEKVLMHKFEKASLSNGIYGKDSNGNFIVSELGYSDKEKTEEEVFHYVMAPDGKIIIDKQADAIREFNGFYLIGNFSITQVMDKDGKALSDGDKRYYEVESLGNGYIKMSNSYSDITDIYSITGEKITNDAKSVSASIYKNYLSIKEGSSYKYYNIDDGKLIYAQ